MSTQRDELLDTVRIEVFEAVVSISDGYHPRSEDDHAIIYKAAETIMSAIAPRMVVSIEELDALRTGTIVRSKHGDIGSIDHGPHGNARARVHLLDFVMVHGSMSLEEFSDGDLPMTVLFAPEVTA